MPLPKILLIHGLNNRPEAFWSLRDSLVDLGYIVHLITLPGHGEERTELENWNRSSAAFKETMKDLTKDPYVVIAFSQGALHFQDYMTENLVTLPVAQILLAPALFLRNYSIVKRLAKILPATFKIPSTMPKPFRRYDFLYVGEYRNLLEGVKKFGEGKLKFPVPTMVIVDKKDELVDAAKLKAKFDSHVTILERPFLFGRRPGKHHIIFHPDYYENQGWEKFITDIHQWIGLNSFPS